MVQCTQWHSFCNSFRSPIQFPFFFRRSSVYIAFNWSYPWVSGYILKPSSVRCHILTACSSLYTGRAGDWLVLKTTRARGGAFEPEYRLWLFSLSGVLIPFGLVLWGVGAAHDVQWFGVIFAMGVLGFTNSLGIQVSISYCIESYRELSSEAIVTVTLIRNVMSFAIGYGFAISPLPHKRNANEFCRITP